MNKKPPPNQNDTDTSSTLPLSSEALRHFSEEGIQKYLLETDQPDWDALRDNEGFSDMWVVFFVKRSRPISQVELKRIYTDSAFRKTYAIRLWLLRNRQTPIAISLNIMNTLMRYDLFNSLKHSNTALPVKKRIEKKLEAEFPTLPLGEKIALARQAPRPLIRFLRTSGERPVIRAVLNNFFFTYDDAMFLANNSRVAPHTLEELASSSRWKTHKAVRRALLSNPRTPSSCLPALLRGLTPHDLRELLREPSLSGYARQLIRREMGRTTSTEGSRKNEGVWRG